MLRTRSRRWLLAAFLLLQPAIPGAGRADTPPNIYRSTLAEADAAAPEISTEELKDALAAGKAVVFDARPALEFAISHIPGARNVAAKPGVPMSDYVSDVAEVGRVVNGDKTADVVVYCNGPFCGKSKRLAAELAAARYTHVRRYQLGIPVWRALGEATQIEPAGLHYVLAEDHTACVIDAREPAAFGRGSIPRARNIPRSGILPGKDVGVVKEAKNDGRLPMEDHNTRIIVVAANGADARFVAEALTHEAFHNVAFFGGTFKEAAAGAK